MEHSDFSGDISSDDIINEDEHHEYELTIEKHFISMIAFKNNGTYKVLA